MELQEKEERKIKENKRNLFRNSSNKDCDY